MRAGLDLPNPYSKKKPNKQAKIMTHQKIVSDILLIPSFGPRYCKARSGPIPNVGKLVGYWLCLLSSYHAGFALLGYKPQILGKAGSLQFDPFRSIQQQVGLILFCKLSAWCNLSSNLKPSYPIPSFYEVCELL